MSQERISGMSFDFYIGNHPIHAENVSLTISDNTAVAHTRGIPDGFVAGDVTAEGDIELDERQFSKLNAAALTAGSWRGLPLTTFVFFASRGGTRSKVEAFGVKILPTDILNIDAKGGAKSNKKIKFMVTSPDFVRINGIPYLSQDDTRFLTF